MTPSSFLRQILPLRVRRRGVGVALLAYALAQSSVSAQGDFVVQGRVVADDTGKPLPGASITLTQERTITRADAEGRFEIAVPSAQPTFMVTKPGFVRTVGRGAKGQRNLVVRLPRGGVITVHVFDSAGEPRPTTVRVAGGKDNRSMSLSGGTDERGQLRIPNLIEGRYTVTVGASTSVQVRLPPRELSDAEVIQLREEITRRSRNANAKADAAVTVDVRAGRETVVHLVDVPPPAAASTIVLSGAQDDKGTAAVAGRVVDAYGTPMPGARVSLLRGLVARGAVSDASGAFVIDNLPAGTARMTVSKPGFSMVESDPAATGMTVSLSEGERRQGILLTMLPGSEITGTVLDEYGEPVERAMVQLLRMGVNDGSVKLVSAGGGATDERGRYRIPRVGPGAYALLTIGNIAHQGQTYLFYPGVVSLEAAHMLEVPEGRDVTGIDFRLNPELGQRISGIVVDSDGRPLSGGVELAGSDARGVPIQRRTVNLTRSGAFEVLNVAPGRYTLSVRSLLASPLPPVVNGQVVRPSAAPEYGVVEIQVGDTPPARVVIRTAPGTPPLPR